MMTRTKWIRWAPDWHNREVASLSSCLGNNRYVSACFSFFFSLFLSFHPPFNVQSSSFLTLAIDGVVQLSARGEGGETDTFHLFLLLSSRS